MQTNLSTTQRWVMALLPSSWRSSIEKESREWIVTCPCGHSRSVWDLGGIRWKAAGNPTWKRVCPQCRQLTWHTVSHQPKA
ncbi:MAG: hypothetical protein ACAI35_05095 [Candidatus Methylacidiphilales bacterium]|nr:hypothetical protein [Candidatus Methylacidiphilales bacterium]